MQYLLRIIYFKNAGLRVLSVLRVMRVLRVLRVLKVLIRVGKVSGIEVSGRVSGMPEMPGTKLGFGRPK